MSNNPPTNPISNVTRNLSILVLIIPSIVGVISGEWLVAYVGAVAAYLLLMAGSILRKF